MTSTFFRGFALALGVALLGSAAVAQQPDATDPTRDGMPGKAVFDQKCAMCHMHSQMMRARPMAEVRAMPAAKIKEALTTGVMKMQGAGLSDEEKDQVAAYLGIDGAGAPPAAAPTTAVVSSTTTTTTTTSTTH